MKSRLFNTPVCHNPVVHMAAGLSRSAGCFIPSKSLLVELPLHVCLDLKPIHWSSLKKKITVVDSSARNISEEERNSYMRVLEHILHLLNYLQRFQLEQWQTTCSSHTCPTALMPISRLDIKILVSTLHKEIWYFKENFRNWSLLWPLTDT